MLAFDWNYARDRLAIQCHNITVTSFHLPQDVVEGSFGFREGDYAFHRRDLTADAGSDKAGTSARPAFARQAGLPRADLTRDEDRGYDQRLGNQSNGAERRRFIVTHCVISCMPG